MIVRAGMLAALLLIPVVSEAFASPQAYRAHLVQRGQILRGEIFGTSGRDVCP